MNKYVKQQGDVRAVVGRILTASGSTVNQDGRLVYTTEKTAYRISATIQGDDSAIVLEAQVPCVRLWPRDFEIDAARLIGANVIGAEIGNTILWHFVEPPMVTDCPSVVSPAMQMRLDSAGGSTGIAIPSGPATPTTPTVPSNVPSVGEN